MTSLLRTVRWLAGPALLLLGGIGNAAGVGGGAFGPESPGDDDVGSMPSVLAPDAPSLVLLGTYADLDAVVLDLQGTGTTKMRPVAPGSEWMLLELEGSFSVALDPAVLATGRVRTLLGVGTHFGGGTASFFAGRDWSSKTKLTSFDVHELPLLSIAATGASFALHADSPDRASTFTLWSRAEGGALRVTQNLRTPAP